MVLLDEARVTLGGEGNTTLKEMAYPWSAGWYGCIFEALHFVSRGVRLRFFRNTLYEGKGTTAWPKRYAWSNRAVRLSSEALTLHGGESTAGS